MLGAKLAPVAVKAVLVPLITMKPLFDTTQLPAMLGGFATTNPLGSESSTLTLLNVVLELGLPTVSVRVVVPLNGMVLAPKAFVIVGG